MAILSVNILLVLLFCRSFLGVFYVGVTKQKIINYNNIIQTAYNNKTLSKSTLRDSSQDNITVVIYNKKLGEFMLSSARGHSEGDEFLKEEISSPQNWIQDAKNKEIFDKLRVKSPIIQEQNNSILLYSTLADDIYIIMQTPKQFIDNTVEVAINFFVIVSFSTMVIGGVIVYFVSKKIAKPIKEIDTAAQRIARMDFSQLCDIHTGDETEELGNSVNKMAVELEKNINLLKKDLEREESTNTLRKEFVANVSHDLKTPLALVSSYTQALEDGSVGQEEAIEVLHEQCSFMDRLINQMLTLSRLESGFMKYEMSPFSVDDMAYGVLQKFKLLINKNNINIKTEIEPDCVAIGDYSYISQAFNNLFENAIKYVDDKKEIKVSISKDESDIKVSIFNTHENLADDELRSLFEMFYKTDKSRGNHQKSYGLGLAIVSNIVKDHKGSYGAENAQDGLCFWFTLPSLNLEEFDDDDKE